MSQLMSLVEDTMKASKKEEPAGTMEGAADRGDARESAAAESTNAEGGAPWTGSAQDGRYLREPVRESGPGATAAKQGALSPERAKEKGLRAQSKRASPTARAAGSGTQVDVRGKVVVVVVAAAVAAEAVAAAAAAVAVAAQADPEESTRAREAAVEAPMAAVAGTLSSRAGALCVDIVDIKRSAALPTRRTPCRGVRAARGGATPKNSARRRRPSLLKW
ncbi:unnamed protein product [Ectocarpus sp. CCAP 1310/34]|nr:unnamed protein product [Ectocarpus sp. CCAP 1310/34]